MNRPYKLLRTAALLGLGLGVGGVTAGQAQAQTTAANKSPAPLACLIEPSRIVNVGSPVVGVLDTVAVERGDTVKVGQLLASLKRDVERANAGAARSRSEAQAELRAAQSAADLAQAKFDRAQELRQQNFISDIALEQARSEADVAKRRVDAAREQQLASTQDAHTALSQLKLRELSATVDGVVMDRYLNPGERVDDRPILRIAQLNPLRVELILPLAALGSLSEGDKVAVWPEYPGASKTVATVERVDRIVDAASRTYRARLALPNPGNRIVAGVRCKADLASASAAPAAAPTPAPTPAPAVVPAAVRAAVPAAVPTVALAPNKPAPLGATPLALNRSN
jgi:membrane fusion protein, heavy metal efflux system